MKGSVEMKVKRLSVRKVGLRMSEIGLLGILIGGMTLDGPDMPVGLILIGLSVVAMAIGSCLYRLSFQQSTVEAVPDAEDDSGRKDAVFQEWVEHGTLR